MTQLNILEARVDRLEDRVDRMNETLVTKQDLDSAIGLLREDIKVVHDRINVLTIIIVVGYIFGIGAAVLTRFIS